MNSIYIRFQQRLKDIGDFDLSILLETYKKNVSIGLVLFVLLNIGSGIYIFSTVFGHGGEDHGEAIAGAHESYPVVRVMQARPAAETQQLIEIHGEVFADNETDVFPLRDGVIKKLFVNLGDQVKAGDVLATLHADIDQLSLQSELGQIDAEIEVGKQTLVNSQKKFAAEQQQIDVRLASKKEQLDQRNIRVLSSLYDFSSNLNRLLFSFGGSIKNNSDTLRRRGLFSDGDADMVQAKVLKLVEMLETTQLSSSQSYVEINTLLSMGLEIGKEIKLITNTNLISTGVQDSNVNEKLAVLSDQINTLVDSSSEYAEIHNEIIQLEAEKVTIDLNIDVQNLKNNLDIELKESMRGVVGTQMYMGNTVYAPFDGVISERIVNVGDSVGAEKPLFHIVDESRKFIRFRVKEADISLIQEGAEISFAPSSHPNMTYQAQVTRIARSLDRSTRTILVEADIDTEDKRMPVLSGMNVRVQIPLITDPAWWVIPEQAMNISGESHFVWMVDAAITTQQLQINVAFIRDGSIFVESGITGKEWIVIKTPTELQIGLEVDTTSQPDTL